VKTYLKSGGDPNLWWYQFFILCYEVGEDFMEELQGELNMPFRPLQFKYPLGEIPRIKCAACEAQLPDKPTLEELLAQTHIYSSLVLEDSTVFLLCPLCEAKVEFYLRNQYSPGFRVYPTEEG
jgi:hypothetical protein